MNMEGQSSCKPKPINLKYLKKIEESCRGSSPALTQPDNAQFIELNDIKEEQFYLEKLRAQRERIENLRECYEKKEEEFAAQEDLLARLKVELTEAEAIKLKNEELAVSTDRQTFEIKRLREQLDDLKNAKEKFEVEDSRATYVKLTEELNGIAVEEETLEAQSCRHTQTLESIKQQNECLETAFADKIKSLKINWANLIQDCQDTIQSNLEKSEHKAALQQQVKDHSDSLQTLSTEIVLTKQNVIQGQAAFDKGAAELIDRRNLTEKCFNDLTKEITSLQLEIERLHVTSKKQRQLLKEQKAQEEGLKASISSEAVLIEKHAETIHQLQVQVKRKDASLAALEEDLRLHRTAAAELRQKMKTLEEFNDCRVTKKENEEKIRGELLSVRAQLEREKKVQVEYIDELVNSFKPLRC